MGSLSYGNVRGRMRPNEKTLGPGSSSEQPTLCHDRCRLVSVFSSGRRDSNPRPPPWQGGQYGAADLQRSAETLSEQGFCISSPPVVAHGFSSSDGRKTGGKASSLEEVS